MNHNYFDRDNQSFTMAAAATSRTSAHRYAAPISSPAARYNKKILKALRRALEKDPEADITSLLPRHYSDKLASYRSEGMLFLWRSYHELY
jgi:hypothetical protein